MAILPIASGMTSRFFAAILAARGWRVSRRNARVGACRRATARTSDHGKRSVCSSLPRERWMRVRRGAAGSRAAERRRRATRCRVHLEARNALVARVGMLGLLAQDHGLVAAVGRTRRRLEAERGALREAEPWCSDQNRRDQAHCRDTRLHGRTSAPPMRPQRTIALIVPGGTRFFGRQSRRRAGGPCCSQDDDRAADLSQFVLAASQVGCPLLWSHTNRSCARLANFS